MTADRGTEAFKKIEFSRVYSFRVGGLPVVFGRISSDETSGPMLFAAALSESDLRHEQCGYGVTEAAAVASLFEYMR